VLVCEEECKREIEQERECACEYIHVYRNVPVFCCVCLSVRLCYRKVCVRACECEKARERARVGSIKLQVSFAKEPCERDDILQKGLNVCMYPVHMCMYKRVVRVREEARKRTKERERERESVCACVAVYMPVLLCLSVCRSVGLSVCLR